MPEQRTDAGSASSSVRAQWAPPLQSDLRAELGSKGPQPLRGRKFTAGLGWAGRRPGPARRSAGLAERSGQSCRAFFPGREVRSLAQESDPFSLTICPRAVRLALPPRPPREKCVKKFLARESPQTQIYHTVAFAAPTAGP